MKLLNLEVVSKTAIALCIGFLFIFLIYSMLTYGDNYLEKQTSNIEKIINKALVQCYALEGQYPVDIEYVKNYGVIFNEDKYIYYYEWYGSNLKPTVIVFEK